MASALKAQAAIESSSGSTARRLHGQAAMEYLVTYGWALFALFAVLAFLLSSGTFSANSFAIQECTFQPDLPCPSFILYSDGTGGATTLQFSLRNGLGFPISIANVSYAANDLGAPGRNEFTPTSFPHSASPIQPGDSMDFNYTFTGTKQPGIRDFRTIFVTLQYTNCRNPSNCTGPYTTSGRISAAVEKES